MRSDIKILTFSILAAAVSSTLCMGLWYNLFHIPLLVLIFGLFVSSPLLIITFTFGIKVGIFSIAITTLFLSCSLSKITALLLTMFFLAPSVFLAWLITLFQFNQEKNIVNWYPLSPALFQLILVISGTTIAIMLYSLSSAEAIRSMNEIIARFLNSLQESNLYPSNDQNLIEHTIHHNFLPIISSTLPAYSFLCHLSNIYFSSRIASQLKVLQRPRDDWPIALRMPPCAFFIFISSWIFNPWIHNNTLILCLSVISSALSVAFMSSGIALIHQITRGYPWRLPILVLLYIGLFTVVLIPFLVLCLIICGLFATPFSKNYNNKIL